MFKFTGTIKVIQPTQQVTETCAKREFVVTDTTSMYPQDIMFQATQDKCSMLDGYNVNDQVEVSFNLRGREWTSPQGEIKYFNTIEAWRIERPGQGAGMPAGGPSAMSLGNAPASTPSSPITAAEEDDDLPF